MPKLQGALAILGRLCISLFFIGSAVRKILDWQANEIRITHLICDWHAYIQDQPMIESFLENLLPFNTLILIVAILLQLIGGLMLLFARHATLAAVTLLIYWLPMMVFSFRYLFVEKEGQIAEAEKLMTHVAILGGLFLAMSFHETEEKGVPQDEKNPMPFGKLS